MQESPGLFNNLSMQFSDPHKSLPRLLNQDNIREGIKFRTAYLMMKCPSGGNDPKYMLLCKLRLSHGVRRN
jgi:hypothetical protein